MARGDLTVLVDPDALRATRPDGRGAGRGRPYPDRLLMLAVIVSTTYRLPLRQTEGFLTMLTGLLGLDVAVPDYTTLCRRRRQLQLPFDVLPAGPMVLLIDATGVTVRAPGRWIEKYGTDPRKRKFVKLHIGVDQTSGRVLASKITGGDGPGTGDVSVGPDLTEQAAGRAELSVVVADRAYDSATNYQAARDAGTVLLTPPKANHTYGGDPDRDQHKAQIGRVGEAIWKQKTGYGSRALVEAWFSSFKRATSDRVRSRSFDGAAAEVNAAVWVYDTWLARA